MIIKNTSKNKILANNAELCSSVWQKFVGLMFSTNKNRSLIFPFNKEKRISLHMIFVFYTIDLIFLNKKKEIIEIKQNFKPFTEYTSKNKTAFVLELPKGAVKKSGSKVGDKILFQK